MVIAVLFVVPPLVAFGYLEINPVVFKFITESCGKGTLVAISVVPDIVVPAYPFETAKTVFIVSLINKYRFIIFKVSWFIPFCLFAFPLVTEDKFPPLLFSIGRGKVIDW